MRLTKFEHSAMLLEQGQERLIIDPGNLTPLLPDLDGVVAVVLTHEHPDHWTPEQLTPILERNPGVRILGPAGVAHAAGGFPVETVSPGDERAVGSFRLRFFGGRHAVIHSSIPVIDNVGVFVNDALYYPGDSFSLPEGVEIHTLAVPVAAPWSKIGEVMDFVDAAAPRRSTPAHEQILSEAGRRIAYARVQAMTEKHGGTFHPLAAGEWIDL